MLNVGVIGVGYWGPNLIRNFDNCSKTKLIAVSDLKQSRLDYVKGKYFYVDTSTNPFEIINHPNIDAVAIATPVDTHFELALSALKNGKHVFIEKPMTPTTVAAEKLIEEAEKRNLVIMVDHTFLYTGAVRKIKELIAEETIGDILYFDSVRVNLGLFQHDVNVIWDLAPHDISIMDHLLQKKPEAISAVGVAHYNRNIENVAYLSVFYPNNLFAHIHTNWLSPVKIRTTLIGGTKKMIVYDDNEPSEKVKVYDKGVSVESAEDVYKMLIKYRTGDMWAPHIENIEALRMEIEHFADCIENKKTPLTDGKAGLRVVQILEAAQKSIKNRGELVYL